MDKELDELIRFVTRNKVKNIEIIGQTNGNNSMVQKFYHKLSEGAFKSDGEAARYFFGTDEKNRNYKELKRRLKKKLLNTIFFVDTNKGDLNSLLKFHYEAQKELAAAKILRLRGLALNNSIAIALKILKKAQKYAMMDLIADCAQILLYYYGTIIDIDNMKKYSALWQKANFALQVEVKAFEYIHILVKLYMDNAPHTQIVHEKAKIFYQELSEYEDQLMSYRFHFFLRYIQTMIYDSIHDYDNSYKVVVESITYLEKHTPWYLLAMRHFSKVKAELCITLQKYDEGIETIKKLDEDKNVKTANWIILKGIYALLLVHDKRYSEAYDVIVEIFKLKSFFNLLVDHKERWILLDAYMNYLIAINKLTPKKKKRFSVGKFLNTLPFFSKKKSNQNISILILHILFLVHRKEYEKVEKRLASLHQYQLRYLNGDMNLRSQYFVKALQYLPKSNYRATELDTMASKYIEQLNNTSMAASKQAFDVEIIPYEHLWDMLLGSLKSS